MKSSHFPRLCHLLGLKQNDQSRIDKMSILVPALNKQQNIKFSQFLAISAHTLKVLERL
jgi:hypothetical protein